jgi:hypothetical protein
VTATSPSTRFASFLATCAPGRIVNANPPWGAYELAPGEEPLGASRAAASVADTDVTRRAKGKRTLALTIPAGEAVDVEAVLRKRGKRAGHTAARIVRARDRTLRLPIRRAAKRGRARVEVKLTDAAGGVVESSVPLRLPRKR